MTRHSFVRPGERHAGRSGAADDRLHERELVGGRGPEEVVVAALGGLQHVGPRAFGYDIDFKSVFA